MRTHFDVLLIGGGVMSSTLAALIHLLDPSRQIGVLEQADGLGKESSDSWHNAGTGHAGYCELNYTPQGADGGVDIGRAEAINARFEVSLQFWASLAERGILPDPSAFIRRVPHLSWVNGQDQVAFLKARKRALDASHLFQGMTYSDDPDTLQEWLPLMSQALNTGEPVAATRVAHGTDVNFGALTRGLGQWLKTRDAVSVLLQQEVVQLRRQDNHWQVGCRVGADRRPVNYTARQIFVGAGGAAISLLQNAGVAEARGYGAFPVSGLWLASERADLAARHGAKVYGQAPVGAPPMSVPHLDTRYLDGGSALLFGPFAGLTTRFLRQSSRLDLLRSVRANNMLPLLQTGLSQHALTRYLVKEGLSSFDARFRQLQTFLPDADPADWTLRQAGQRVQIIRPGAKGKPELAFGTEVLATQDGSLSALLGASPGASVSVDAMLSVLKQCFPELLTGASGQRLQGLIPADADLLRTSPALAGEVRARNQRQLDLAPVSPRVRRTSRGHWSGAA